MDNATEAQAEVFYARPRVTVSAWAACPSAAVDGRLARVEVPSLASGQRGVQGTGVPAASGMHAQPTIRKPYNFTTRLSAIGGGDPGPHPAREPEPV